MWVRLGLEINCYHFYHVCCGISIEFIDEEVPVMLAVLEELTNFTTLLGGSEHEKLLLPLLISFCKLDEKEVANKAMLIMEPILEKNPDENIEAIRKLSKPNMNVSK